MLPTTIYGMELAATGLASASPGVLDQKLKVVHSIDDDGARYDAIANRHASSTLMTAAKR